MKKFLLLLLGLIIAVGASADVNSSSYFKSAKHRAAGQQANRWLKYHQAKDQKVAKFTKPKTSSPDIISIRPEGESKYYERSGNGLEWYYDEELDRMMVRVAEQEGKVRIVYAPDGETVYIKDPVYGYQNGTWVRGTITGNKITVPLGQCIDHEDDPDDPFNLLLEWGTSIEHSYAGYDFVQDETVTEATFTIDGDKISLDNSSPGVNGVGAVGLAVMRDTDHDQLGMDWGTEYTLTEAPPVDYDQPTGEIVAYRSTSTFYDFWDYEVYRTTNIAHFVYAPDGETVYMQFWEEGPWLTATISGNKIHMPLGQYNWYDEYDEYGDIFAWGTVAASPEGEEGAVFVQDNTVTEVTYTIQDGVITMDNSDGGVNGIGAVGLADMSDEGDAYYVEWGTTFTPYTEPTVITEQPEGELKTYSRSGYTVGNGSIYNQEGTVDIVYAPDGQTVYIQDILFGSEFGSWVRGTISSGKIHVPMGQYIYLDNGYGFMLGWGQSYLNNNQWMLNYDPTVTEATFTIDGSTISLDNSSLGPDDGPDGATGLAVVVDVQPNYLLSLDVLTEFYRPEAITEQPEGELVQYVRHGNWIYESGSVVPLGGLMDVVFAPDGQTVYIKDPIDGFRYGTWVKGTLNNGIIDVPVGQILSTETKYNTVLMWGKMALSTTYWIYEFTPDYSKTTIQYEIDGDNIYMLDGSNEAPVYYGPAAMMEDIESAEGVEFEAYYTLYDGPMVITSPPAGDLKTYIRSGSGFYPDGGLNKKDGGNRYIDAPEIKEQYGEANVVFARDGQTVYLQDPVFCGDQYNRGTWVRGTLSNNGTKIHVPLGQYVSWDLDSESGDILAWGSTSLIDFEGNGNLEMRFMPDPDLAEVTYTIANGCISLDYSDGGSYQEFYDLLNQYYNGEIDYETLEQLAAPLFITSGLAYISSEGYWTGESNWGTFYTGKHPATLPDPVVHNWYDAQNENGNSRVDVEIPTVDTDGMPIFEDALSYSIYTDNDQIFTFDASRYYLDENVTEVTYDMWQDSWRLDPHAGIRFFRTNAEGYEPFFNWRIGIQFHYTVDGVKYSTNIVYLEVFEKPNDDMPGDVDGSGNVDVDDITKMIGRVLGDSSQPGFIDANADLNGDHTIDIDDVTIAINKVLGNN